MAGDHWTFENAQYPVDTADMAFSHRYDRKEISKGELPLLFAECCVRERPRGPIRASAHEGPGGPQGPGP